ncbi:MAG: 16S rRNA (cytosine(967)-C(5))-methyltransferase RsmB [Lachnospiraceae bacterium]|nr:16S rRNA (cytosine(967)-C(5))-methyltransferase RsmB [Lachnospiraceae bacterium]
MNRLGEREAVLEILTGIREKGIYSHIAVKEMLDRCEREGMDRRQRAFVKRLTEGVIERRIELDDVLRRYAKKGARIRPVIRDILRMGIFQILYMDSVPDSAACNEAVILTKKYGKKELSGFVNGLLRNVVRDKDAGKLTADSAPAGGELSGTGELSRRYSMPEWIVSMWQEQLGEEETEKLLEALLKVRPVAIRFDDRCSQARREEILTQMSEKGVKAEKGHYLPYCYELTGTDSIQELPGYREGAWTVQDESSMMVAEAVGLAGGETVYDVCAAPGGKAMHCASKLLAGNDGASGKGTVHAFDLSKGKTAQILKNVRRMHLPNVIVEQRDALISVPEEAGKADVLLCDLPCSGLGVIGRKRDIKYHATPKQLAELAQLQKDILRSAVPYLKEGGVLIYSTCTINAGENSEIAEFIEKELGMCPDPLAPYLPETVPGIKGNQLQLLPHVHGTDGFFLARFVKIRPDDQEET